MYCDVEILGIGSAERHWNIVKAVKTRKRDNTGTIKFNKKAFIYSTSMLQKSRCRQEKLISYRKLWSDNDLQGCKDGCIFQ